MSYIQNKGFENYKPIQSKATIRNPNLTIPDSQSIDDHFTP